MFETMVFSALDSVKIKPNSNGTVEKRLLDDVECSINAHAVSLACDFFELPLCLATAVQSSTLLSLCHFTTHLIKSFCDISSSLLSRLCSSRVSTSSCFKACKTVNSIRFSIYYHYHFASQNNLHCNIFIFLFFHRPFPFQKRVTLFETIDIIAVYI